MSANAANPVHAALSALDAIQLTRRLIDIESITYNECAVGEFLAEFLAIPWLCGRKDGGSAGPRKPLPG